MTRFAPLWQQAGSYPATLDRGLIAALYPVGGAIGGVPSTVAGTMTVSVAPGSLAVPLQSGQGTALCSWDAPEVVTIAAATHPAGQTRIDLVVAQVRDAAIDGGQNNDFLFGSVTGVPAASNPAVPATPTNAYVLAQITVPGAAANLNGATLLDRRRGMLAGPIGAGLIKAGSQTLGNAQDTTLAGMSLEWSQGAPFAIDPRTPANSMLTLPYAGRYKVFWYFNIGPTGGGGFTGSLEITFALNTYTNKVLRFNTQGNTWGGRFSGAGVINGAAAGDGLQMLAMHGATGTIAANVEAPPVRFAVEYMGA